MTVGKFYATFLIQDYFRRFKKKKETKLAVERLDTEEDVTGSLQVITVIKYYVMYSSGERKC